MTTDPTRNLRLIPDGGQSPPAFLRDEMARAAELWESLRDDGLQIRYELDEHSGRVSAMLCDLEGRQLRPVALACALGAGEDDHSAA